MNKVDLCHLRMGYIINKIRRKQLHTMIQNLKEWIFLMKMSWLLVNCVLLVNNTNKKNPKGGATKATQLLELIHSDICGPM